MNILQQNFSTKKGWAVEKNSTRPSQVGSCILHQKRWLYENDFSASFLRMRLHNSAGVHTALAAI